MSLFGFEKQNSTKDSTRRNPWLRLVVAFAVCIGLFLWLPVVGANGQDSSGKAQDPKQEKSDNPDEKIARPKVFDAPMDFSKPPEIGEIKGPTEAEIRVAIDRGVQFLLKTQNKDGSWGSHVTRRDFEIFAPIPGAHHAFRAATTSLCVSAMLENRADDSECRVAIKKALDFMLEKLPKLKRATGDAIYNVWGHAYAIQALVRLRKWEHVDDATKKKIDDLIKQQLDMLYRYESIDGGWGYYDFNAQTRKPSGSSISFVNATVLVAMYEAKQAGIEPKEKIVKRAIAAIKRQQKKDFTYLYGEYLKNVPMMGINRPGGSLGRSQACNIALRMWEDKKQITDNVIKHWLYRLYVRNGWLSMGRKRPVPHESWMAVAGYFYFYGHYYAGLNVDALPQDDRAPYQAMLAKIMLRHQEKNGCWWDYTLYSYHQQYGTAYALMTLERCLPDKKESDDKGASNENAGGKK